MQDFKILSDVCWRLRVGRSTNVELWETINGFATLPDEGLGHLDILDRLQKMFNWIDWPLFGLLHYTVLAVAC